MANKFTLFKGVGGNVKMTLNDEAKFEATVGSSASAPNNEVIIAEDVKGNAEIDMSKTSIMEVHVGDADIKDSTDDKDKGDTVIVNVEGNLNVGGDLKVNDKSRKEDFSGAGIGTLSNGTLISNQDSCSSTITAQKD